MPPRSIGSATIGFGLVSIPVRLFVATSSQAIGFNLLHERCGTRIRYQNYCPTCDQVVERSDLRRGLEVARGEYAIFTDEELETLEGPASKVIDIAEFVPMAAVDPIYFEKTYFLGADAGAEKPYRLLAEAMRRQERAAVARYVMRGKENLVLIRPAQGGLMLHVLYYADEVRDFGEIERGGAATVRPGELDLAGRLIGDLSQDAFRPEQYEDEYRKRVLKAAEEKVAGREVVSVPETAAPAATIDLVAALKASLERKPGAKAGAPARPAREAAPAERAGRRRRARAS
jgi:DNA end-binding protein Ku